MAIIQSDNKLFKLNRIVNDWLQSKERKEMLVSKRYFEGFHDILNRQRMVIGEGGKLEPVDNLPIVIITLF